MKKRGAWVWLRLVSLLWGFGLAGCVGTSSPTNAWQEPIDETTGKPVPGVHSVFAPWPDDE